MNRRSLLLAGLWPLAACASRGDVQPTHATDAVPDKSVLLPLFMPGAEFELTTGGRVRVSIHHAGMLNLPTGQIIAADLSWLTSPQRLDITPYTASVSPGRYPISLSVMNKDGVDLVAAAKLSISDFAPVGWEPALRPGQDPASLPPGEYFGVGVDTGNAGFLDEIALQYMAERGEKAPEDLTVLRTRLAAERADPVSGANYIVFNSGYGDGHYPVWIGRQADGTVTCFVMDMLIARLPPASRR